MDAFYAAIEQLDRPELRGQPVLVGHPGGRGVVTTASYEARPFGVGSAMPMAQARRRCPQAIIVPPRMKRYSEVSGVVMGVFDTFSPLVEALSLDEAFLDMTGTEGLFGPPEVAARKLKNAVFEATGGLRVSVGVATSKYVAKVASDLDKPDGLTVIPADRTFDVLWPLPVSRLWGVGPKSQARVEALGLRTIGDVARADPDWLKDRLGSLGPHIWRLAQADDRRDVIPHRDAGSVGAEQTLEHDVVGADAIRPWLRRSADRIARRLRKSDLRAGGVRVKLKTAEFQIRTRQAPLPVPTQHADDLLDAGWDLLEGFDLSAPMRLVGLAAYDLRSGAPAQAELFTDEGRARDRALDAAVDAIAARFGDTALKRAADLDHEGRE